jgi:TonB family protein
MLINKYLLVSVAVLLFGCTFCFAQDAPSMVNGDVISIEDGNTLLMSAEKNKIRVRLIGVDVPVGYLSKESRESLASLVRGKQVSVVSPKSELQEGKKQLMVGKVLLGDLDIGLEQIRSGFAWQSKEFEKDQPQNEIDRYSDAEKVAGADKRGIWDRGFNTCKIPSDSDSVLSSKPEASNSDRPKVSGTVIVRVTINEDGKVVSARALCGHPLLQNAAVSAALHAKFSSSPYKVTGTINYNFMLDTD